MEKSPRTPHRFVCANLVTLGLIATVISTVPARATTLYWDTNGTTAGAGASYSGTWGANSFWTTDSAGVTNTFQTTTASADDLYIVAGPSATSGNTASTITVSGNEYANSITTQASGILTLNGTNGGVLYLGAGGITMPALAYTGMNNARTLNLNAGLTINLTANQTWATAFSNGDIININSNLTGSGNLTVTNAASPNDGSSGNLQFLSGSSAGWTGSLTFNGGMLYFVTSQQAVTRLNSSTLTLKNTSAGNTTVRFTQDTGRVTNFTNGIAFSGAGGNTYVIALDSNRGGDLMFSGQLSGTLTKALQFIARGVADLSGTGQYGRVLITADNSSLIGTSSISGTDAIEVYKGYVVLQNANAIGVGNSLGVQIGYPGNGSGMAEGLFATSGYNVSSNITVVKPYGGNTGADVFLGLDGTGSVRYSGSMVLNGNTTGRYVNNLHLRALAGGTATFDGPISDIGSSIVVYVPVLVDGGGKVVLTGTNTYAGNTIVNAGTLALDFSQRDGASNIINSGSNASSLTLGGGALNVIGRASAVNSQRFNGTTFNTGASAIQLSATTGNTVALTLGALTRKAGSTVDFTLPTGGQSDTNGISTTTTSLSNNVLVSAAINGVAYATVGGADWASLSGSNIVALSSYSNGSYTSTDNADVIADDTVAADSTVNTLRFNDATARILTLSGDATVSTGGILVTSAAANGATIAGGTLRSGGGTELAIINNGGNFAVNSVIADSTGGASALTLSGTGVTTLGGTNTYSGVTTVNNGTLSISSTSALGSGTSAVILGDAGHKGTLSYTGSTATYTRGIIVGAGGAELDVTTAGQTLTVSTGTVAASGSTSAWGGLTLGGAGNVAVSSVLALGYGGLTVNTTGTVTLSAANTYTGDTTINAGTLKLGSTSILNASSAIVVNAGILDLGGYTSNTRASTVTLNGGLIQNGTLAMGGNTLYATSGTISAAVTSSGGSLDGSIYKSGTGTLVLNSGNISLSGTTNIVGGAIQLGNGSALAASTVALSVDNGLNFGTLTTAYIAALSGANNLVLSNTAGTAFTLQVGNQSYLRTTTYSGVLSGSGNFAQSWGTTTLTNSSSTYTGQTSVTRGTLSINSIADLGVASAIGAPTTVANGTINLNYNGTLIYTGTTASTNRKVTVGSQYGGGIAYLDQSGTGLLKLTGTVTSDGNSNGNILTLQGSTSGTGEIAGNITNGFYDMGIAKAGTGTWVLSGSNTYTGSTTIGNGTLQLGNGGNTGSLSTSSVIVDNGNLAINRSNAVLQGKDFSGAAITGSGSFTQAGSGTTTLTAVNTYTGATSVLAGELDVNGSLSASSAVSVASGATLSGSGTVGGSVAANNATIRGNHLTLGATVLDGTSQLSGTTSASSFVVNTGTTTNQGITTSTAGLSVKAGATLDNRNSFTATTTVTVEHTASLTNNGLITAPNVNVTGVLSGTGTIVGALTIKTNGELAPGNSPGTQTVQGSLTVETGAKVSMQLESLSSFDKIIVSDGVTLAGTLALDFSDAFLAAAGALTSGTSLTLIDNTSANAIGTTFENITYTTSSGTYTATGNAFTVGNVTYGITYTGGDNNDLALTVSVVPEPSTWAMLVGGLGVLVLGQRMRRRNA